MALLVALIEAGWYGAVLGRSFWAVLAANSDPFATTRPAWWTLVSGRSMSRSPGAAGLDPLARRARLTPLGCAPS